MTRQTVLEFHQGKLQFAAGHFTIFSATEREKIHGHNYSLSASITTDVDESGIAFDYRIFKEKLKALCEQLNIRFLLPIHSPHLKIEEEGEYCYAVFNGKRIPFLKEDVLLLPLTNITLEELSSWFLEQLRLDPAFIEKHRITQITIKVFNGSEQCAQTQWLKTFMDIEK